MIKFKVALGLMSFLLCLALMSNSGGRAAVGGQGTTGAPGEGTCGNPGCHAAGNFDPTVNIAVLDDNGEAIMEYYPNQTYKVSVTINAGSGNPSGYGFQILALDDADNDLSVWSNPSSNAQLVSLGSKNYVEQQGPSTSNTFEVEWTASTDGLSSVNFYVSGNAINGNGSPGQDGTATASLSIPRAVLSTHNLAQEVNLSVSPNPVMDRLSIDLSTDFNDIEVIDLTGKVILQSTDSQIDVSSITAGTYIVKVNLQEGKVATTKIVKL